MAHQGLKRKQWVPGWQPSLHGGKAVVVVDLEGLPWGRPRIRKKKFG